MKCPKEFYATVPFLAQCYTACMAERKPQKPKTSKREKVTNFFRSPLFKVLLSIFLFFFIGTSAFVLYYYNYYSRIIDRKLSGEIFKNTAQIYAAPFRVYPGQKLSEEYVDQSPPSAPDSNPLKKAVPRMVLTKSKAI